MKININMRLLTRLQGNIAQNNSSNNNNHISQVQQFKASHYIMIFISSENLFIAELEKESALELKRKRKVST